MIKKYIFIFIVTFSESSIAAGTLLIALSFISMVLQTSLLPFRIKVINQMSLLSKIAISSSVLFVLVAKINGGAKFVWIFSIVFLASNLIFIIKHFTLYYRMNETLMNYFHKICWCLPIKKFRLDKNDGTMILYDQNFHKNFSIILNLKTRSRRSNDHI